MPVFFMTWTITCSRF